LHVSVPHFGRILQDLRKDRGLSQVELGAIAGVSDFTISRGERSETCPWKSRTALEVLIALNRRLPVPLDRQREYLSAAGLDELAESSLGIMTDQSPRIDMVAEGTAAPIGRKISPEESTAYIWIETLLDERGAKNLLTALEGLAAGWGVDLPPRITHDELHRTSTSKPPPQRRSA
jgi:transcriptional regulator with XRE-family HTH domain